MPKNIAFRELISSNNEIYVANITKNYKLNLYGEIFLETAKRIGNSNLETLASEWQQAFHRNQFAGKIEVIKESDYFTSSQAEDEETAKSENKAILDQEASTENVDNLISTIDSHLFLFDASEAISDELDILPNLTKYYMMLYELQNNPDINKVFLEVKTEIIEREKAKNEEHLELSQGDGFTMHQINYDSLASLDAPTMYANVFQDITRKQMALAGIKTDITKLSSRYNEVNQTATSLIHDIDTLAQASFELNVKNNNSTFGALLANENLCDEKFKEKLHEIDPNSSAEEIYKAFITAVDEYKERLVENHDGNYPYPSYLDALEKLKTSTKNNNEQTSECKGSIRLDILKEINRTNPDAKDTKVINVAEKAFDMDKSIKNFSITANILRDVRIEKYDAKEKKKVRKQLKSLRGFVDDDKIKDLMTRVELDAKSEIKKAIDQKQLKSIEPIVKKLAPSSIEEEIKALVDNLSPAQKTKYNRKNNYIIYRKFTDRTLDKIVVSDEDKKQTLGTIVPPPIPERPRTTVRKAKNRPLPLTPQQRMIHELVNKGKAKYIMAEEMDARAKQPPPIPPRPDKHKATHANESSVGKTIEAFENISNQSENSDKPNRGRRPSSGSVKEMVERYEEDNTPSKPSGPGR